jgi:hypothetical protein
MTRINQSKMPFPLFPPSPTFRQFSPVTFTVVSHISLSLSLSGIPIYTHPHTLSHPLLLTNILFLLLFLYFSVFVFLSLIYILYLRLSLTYILYLRLSLLFIFSIFISLLFTFSTFLSHILNRFLSLILKLNHSFAL